MSKTKNFGKRVDENDENSYHDHQTKPNKVKQKRINNALRTKNWEALADYEDMDD